MVILFVALIIIFSIVLGFIVLVQNPKGGGLTGTIGGFSTQFMGVKQTTDVLEKGTWIFAGVIGFFCLISSFFLAGSGTAVDKTKDIAPTQQTTTNPGNLPSQPGTK